jgi:exosome complex component CSL4
MTNNQNQLSVPGQFLGVSEEFVGGPGTFEESDGKIYSKALGQMEEDSASRTVSVKATKTIRPLSQGDVVFARVDDLYESMALVNFQAAPYGSITPAGSGSAFIRISELDNSYVERLQDYLRIGDFVKARVVEIKTLGTYLTMKGPDLGVVRAFCSRDRSEMALVGSSYRCPNCGRTEARKIPGVAHAQSGGYRRRDFDGGGRRGNFSHSRGGRS